MISYIRGWSLDLCIQAAVIKIVDLRSDTVTRPTVDMRRAMAAAEVGDDGYREDPTVIRLEERAASLVGKEAAVFVPSGTMANQIAVLTHTERGDEIFTDTGAHIYYSEAGSPAMLAGVQVCPVEGLLSETGLENLQKALRPPNIHFPRPRLLCLENTFNRGGGAIMPPGEMAAFYSLARARGLKVHLDGARTFNAAVASGLPATDFTRYCDSLMFCLSKGLGAPVGSLLAGTADFIGRARRYRQALGGGMRQAGVLAAAGLVALGRIPELAEDHHNARTLAEGLAGIKGLSIDPGLVQTNIVLVRTAEPAEEVAVSLAARGIWSLDFGTHLLRFVTHKDVGRDDINYALQVIDQVLS